jgi:hypothetical protein
LRHVSRRVGVRLPEHGRTKPSGDAAVSRLSKTTLNGADHDRVVLVGVTGIAVVSKMTKFADYEQRASACKREIRLCVLEAR